MKSRSAFTLVELLVVIAIIGILTGIITIAASGAIRSARAKRAEAMRVALEQGIAAYYAQEGVWPPVIESRSKNMSHDTYTFTPSETDDIFREVVGKGFGRSGGRRTVLVDAMALFVADSTRIGNSGRGCYDNHDNKKNSSTYCGDQKCIYGVDFSVAVARSGRDHLRFSQMAFGYQGTEEGRFRRFWITYNGQTDSVTVSK